MTPEQREQHVEVISELWQIEQTLSRIAVALEHIAFVIYSLPERR